MINEQQLKELIRNENERLQTAVDKLAEYQLNNDPQQKAVEVAWTKEIDRCATRIHAFMTVLHG